MLDQRKGQARRSSWVRRPLEIPDPHGKDRGRRATLNAPKARVPKDRCPPLLESSLGRIKPELASFARHRRFPDPGSQVTDFGGERDVDPAPVPSAYRFPSSA